MSAAEQGAVPRGRMAEVGGERRLRYVPAGPDASPRPLVLLEAGSFGFSADWAAVQAKLAAAGLRSIAYDRAGLGVSDPGPMPRDSIAMTTWIRRWSSRDRASVMESASAEQSGSSGCSTWRTQLPSGSGCDCAVTR